MPPGPRRRILEIPVVYRLQERDLIAQIDTPHIVHVKNSGYTLTKIYLLSNLFSTTAQEEGYRHDSPTAAARSSRTAPEMAAVLP